MASTDRARPPAEVAIWAISDARCLMFQSPMTPGRSRAAGAVGRARREPRRRSSPPPSTEYGEHGWSGFTMDAVARRAGCRQVDGLPALARQGRAADRRRDQPRHGAHRGRHRAPSRATCGSWRVNMLRHFHSAGRLGRRCGSPSTARAPPSASATSPTAVTEVHGRQVEQICRAGDRARRDDRGLPARRRHRGDLRRRARSTRSPSGSRAAPTPTPTSRRAPAHVVAMVLRGIADRRGSAAGSARTARGERRRRTSRARRPRSSGGRRARSRMLPSSTITVGMSRQVERRRGRSGSRGRRRRRCSWRPAGPGARSAARVSTASRFDGR